MTTTRTHTNIKFVALVLAITVSALGVWFHNAGTALAPEPALLTVDLTGNTGASAVAVYVNSASKTTAVSWPATLTGGSIAAGTPCSNVPLTNGQTTSKVIVAVGALRKCS